MVERDLGSDLLSHGYQERITQVLRVDSYVELVVWCQPLNPLLLMIGSNPLIHLFRESGGTYVGSLD